MSMWQIALRRLEMPILNFLAYFVGGAAFAGFFSAVVIILLTGGISEGALFSGFAGIFLLVLLPTLRGGAALHLEIAATRGVAKAFADPAPHLTLPRGAIGELTQH